MTNDNILTMRELVDLYDKGELDVKALPEMVPCYMTTAHKETKSLCWTTPTEIVGMSDFKKEIRKKEAEFFWTDKR